MITWCRRIIVLILLVAISGVPKSFVYAEGASLFVTPEKGSYAIGDTFEVQIRADTAGEAVNAAEAELHFNTSNLEVEKISTEGSLLQSWSTEPSFSNTDGIIQFAGWMKEKYVGNNGLLLTITFKALRNSMSGARLAAGAIIAADGVGSNIISTMRSAAFSIAPREELPTQRIKEEDVVASSSDQVAIEHHDPPGPPTFASTTQTLFAGDTITVIGTTIPHARILIFLQKGDDPATQSVTRSDDAGVFAFSFDEKAAPGVYRVWAQAEDENGLRSAPSAKVKITVQPTSASTFLALIMAVAPYMMGLFSGALIVGYILHTRHRQRYA